MSNEHMRLALKSHAIAARSVMQARDLMALRMRIDPDDEGAAESQFAFEWFADRKLAMAERHSREAELHELRGGIVFPGGDPT